MKQHKYLANLKINPNLATSKLNEGLIVEIQDAVADLLERKRTTLEKGLRSSSPIDLFQLQDIEEALDVLNSRVLSYYKPMVVH